MHTYLSNLYNGDQALGESTNQFLNENWQDIFDEIKTAIFDAFSLIIQSTLNNVFARHDYYRDLFKLWVKKKSALRMKHSFKIKNKQKLRNKVGKGKEMLN